MSSPWMPPVCSFCKEVGHSLKSCKVALVTCLTCKSVSHITIACPRTNPKASKKKPPSTQNVVAHVVFTPPQPKTIETTPKTSKGKEK
ncbi:hypothetical protein V5N11_007173 [Cardamine amara subsp. amara]|uniref:Uncharacterized protein n=1 Tax=Cardamine amara subsp. amara TaxID=228776 RepID=A0ABD1AD25_CARAN